MPRPRLAKAIGKGGEACRAAVLDGHRAARGLPGGGREQHQARGPAAVPHARIGVGLVRDGDQVVGVGDPEEDDAQAEQGPRAIGAPATQCEGGDDHGEQDEVADRVGEVGGHAERVATDRVHDGLQDDRGAHGCGRQRGGEPIDPQRARRALDARAHEQAQAREDERIEGQVAGVGDRRHGDDRVLGEDQRPVDVAAGPQQRARSDEAPGEALASADRARAPQRQQGCADDHDPVGELAEGRTVQQRAQRTDLRLAEARSNRSDSASMRARAFPRSCTWFRPLDRELEPSSAPYGVGFNDGCACRQQGMRARARALRRPAVAGHRWAPSRSPRSGCRRWPSPTTRSRPSPRSRRCATATRAAFLHHLPSTAAR
jgi:hypothetical protein